MSDHDPQLDEIVSAHLDGETSADEAARVEGDPELRQRRDELAAARDAIRADVPRLDPAEREALLARVLAAVDPGETAEPAETTAPLVAPVTPIGRWSWFEPSRVVAIAAAVLAIAFIGASLAMLGSSGDDGGDSAASAPEAVSMAADAAAGAGTTQSTPQVGGAVTDLGALADETSLRAALDAALAAQAATTGPAERYGPSGAPEGQEAPPSDGQDNRSADPEALSSDDQSFRAGDAQPCSPPADALVFRATLSGREVVVHVQSTGALHDVRVLDATTCGDVLQFTR